MPTPLSGPGLGLPLPQSLYPSELYGAPPDMGTNSVTLAQGSVLPVPAGTFYVTPGMYCQLQYQDPVTGVWSTGPTAGWQSGPVYIKSDGFNYRVANLTGCPVSASVLSAGASYVQASTSISVVGHNSTWQPIVGGQLATATFISYGAGYGVPPIAIIPPPPGPNNNPNGVGGTPASGYVTIAGGTVSGFTFVNVGAGYPTAPTIVLVPSPADPNLALGITNATIGFSLTGSGSITGVLCTNNGSALPNGSLANLTLTVAGAGASATVSPNVLQTVVNATATITGGGLGTNIGLTTFGGAPQAGSIANSPDINYLSFRPRPADIGLATAAAGSVTAGTAGAIYDGGLFQSAPSGVLVYGGAAAAVSITTANYALTMGGRADKVTIQPAP